MTVFVDYIEPPRRFTRGIVEPSSDVLDICYFSCAHIHTHTHTDVGLTSLFSTLANVENVLGARFARFPRLERRYRAREIPVVTGDGPRLIFSVDLDRK